MKKCFICKEYKKTISFNKNKSKKDGLNSICRDCSKLKSREFYLKNKEKQKRQILFNKKKRIEENKVRIFNYLLEHPCAHCNESNPVVLEFDHLHSKNMNISQMLGEGYSWNKIEEEIKKCQVLCANCHRIKTAKDQEWYSYKFLS